MAKTSIDFIERDRGPEGWRALTIELESDYLEEFYEALKDNLPYGAWRYSPEHSRGVVRPAGLQRHDGGEARRASARAGVGRRRGRGPGE
jgi:hypothetical protein